jgi:hypothetical protein
MCRPFRRIPFVLISHLLLLTCSGCGVSHLEVSHAELTGDEIMIEARAYTYVVHLFMHTSEQRDMRYYRLRYSLPAESPTIVQPTAIASVPWNNKLEASYSCDRSLLVQSPRSKFDLIDWGCELVTWSKNEPDLKTLVKRW